MTRLTCGAKRLAVATDSTSDCVAVAAASATCSTETSCPANRSPALPPCSLVCVTSAVTLASAFAMATFACSGASVTFGKSTVAAVEPVGTGWPVQFQVQFQIQMQELHGRTALQSHCHVQFGAPARVQSQFHVQVPAACSSVLVDRDVTWPNWPLVWPSAPPQIQFHEDGCVSSAASTLWASSRSQFHVHTQTWSPFAPGCWRRSPSTTIERSVSSPFSVVATAVPAPVAKGSGVPALVDAALCCVTAPDVPSLSTLTETLVFWTPF